LFKSCKLRTENDVAVHFSTNINLKLLFSRRNHCRPFLKPDQLSTAKRRGSLATSCLKIALFLLLLDSLVLFFHINFFFCNSSHTPKLLIFWIKTVIYDLTSSTAVYSGSCNVATIISCKNVSCSKIYDFFLTSVKKSASFFIRLRS
jgi:hypothetical protein